MQKYRNVGKRIKMILFSLFIATGLFAQGLTPQDKLKNDFPQLTARYGTQIGDQKAHYVFVLDISSSMLPYESIEKQNLLKFVDAVPDGDQITIIRMADEKHTDFVNMFKCITLEPNVRQALRTSVQSPGFQFLKNGECVGLFCFIVGHAIVLFRLCGPLTADADVCIVIVTGWL